MMERREFLTYCATLPVATAVPMAPALAATAQPALRWFMVGIEDGAWEAIQAPTATDAMRIYADEHGATVAEHDCDGRCHARWDSAAKDFVSTDPGNPCRFCGADPDAPCASVEASEPRAWADLDAEPTPAEWVAAGGCHLTCEACGFSMMPGEGGFDLVRDGIVVCDCCASEIDTREQS